MGVFCIIMFITIDDTVNSQCLTGQFDCSLNSTNSQCINNSLVCDGNEDCLNAADEAICGMHIHIARLHAM